MKKKLTTTKVAALLGVSDQSVANWIDNGQLKAGKTPGGHRRIEKEDLIDFLQRQGLKIPQELIGDASATVLIVDDDPAVCQWLSEVIASNFRNCRVLQANDGYSAGELVTSERPRLLLLDLYMPGLDGFEVCRRIKSRPESKGCVVLGMTAEPSRQAEQDILDAGAVGCLSKPLQVNELCARLAEHLQSK